MQLGLEERDYGFWAVELRSAKGTQGPFIGCVGLSVPHWNAAFTPCMDIGWRLGRDIGEWATPVKQRAEFWTTASPTRSRRIALFRIS